VSFRAGGSFGGGVGGAERFATLVVATRARLLSGHAVLSLSTAMIDAAFSRPIRASTELALNVPDREEPSLDKSDPSKPNLNRYRAGSFSPSSIELSEG